MSARELLEVTTPSWNDAVPPVPVVGLVVGELTALVGSMATPLVRWHDAGGARTAPARTAVALSPADVGVSLALMFENADASRPVVVGLLRSAAQPVDQPQGRIAIEADGERLVVRARQCLELRCGAASIKLECDGTIAIHGTQLVSHAEGVNRILGGSIHLN